MSSAGLAGPGTLIAGAPADLILWRCDDPASVPYRYGAAMSLIERVYVAGISVAGGAA